jgi:hypothetical protein
VEALYVISETAPKMRLTYLTDVQKENPIQALNEFFQKFSIDYVRRELSDFLEVGIGHENPFPNDFTPWQPG